MKKFTEKEESTGWQPSLKEAKNLEEALKMFDMKRIGIRLIPKFLLWCQKQDLISLSENGAVSVKNPLGYTRAIETNSLREWHNQKELEHLFQTFPEEKVAYDTKIQTMLAEWRTKPTHG